MVIEIELSKKTICSLEQLVSSGVYEDEIKALESAVMILVKLGHEFAKSEHISISLPNNYAA